MTAPLDLAALVAVKPAYLIRKHGGYYRPNSRGYTGSAIQAGRYTLEEAEGITHPNGPDGPRDGMSYIHEDDVVCEDLTVVRALRAAITASEARGMRMGLIQAEKLAAGIAGEHRGFNADRRRGAGEVQSAIRSAIRAALTEAAPPATGGGE